MLFFDYLTHPYGTDVVVRALFYVLNKYNWFVGFFFPLIIRVQAYFNIERELVITMRISPSTYLKSLFLSLLLTGRIVRSAVHKAMINGTLSRMEFDLWPIYFKYIVPVNDYPFDYVFCEGALNIYVQR